MNIRKKLLAEDKLKPLYDDAMKLSFGSVFTDYMFVMKYKEGKGWYDAEIKPYENISLDPSAIVFHYGQEVFEGQKAYLSPKNEILMFRPFENAKRMNRSLERMCMPQISEEDYIKAEEELLKLEKRWIPKVKGSALYLRPTVIGTEPGLGVRPANEFLFFIILSPVGPYYKEGFNPIGLWACEKYTRAVIGGTGEAKTGGNYAGSLKAILEANKMGYSQVLWLDAIEHKYAEEVGAMNMFFVINNKLVTAPLKGSILPGITRKSIIEMADDIGIEVEERPVSMDEIVKGVEDGSLEEAFGAGTAAVISPVGKIFYKDKEYIINNNKTGKWAQRIFDMLTSIQYGENEDKYGWIYKVK